MTEDEEIEYILGMTEEQLFAEMRERGLDPDEEARKMAKQFKVIARLTDQNDKLRRMITAGWARTIDYTKRHQAERLATQAEIDRLRAIITRAATHLPGRPDVAESILSEATPCTS